MPNVDEVTRNTLDVLVYVQQLTNDVDKLYPRKECDDSKEDIVSDE